MICDKCSKETYHSHCIDHSWLCIDCAAEKKWELHVENAPMVKAFEPYMLEHGPKDLIPDSDPNKKLFFTDDGKRCADLDSIHITSSAEEKRYYDLMKIRTLEKGEKVMGIKAELKDKPKPRLYFFSKKSCCSS